MSEEIEKPETGTTAEEAPGSAGNVKRCLIFSSGDLLFFLSTEYITEIINGHAITPLPVVPKYVRGVLNLRGSILPVADVRMLMGKEPTEYDDKTCIIVLHVDSTPLGILADRVESVQDIDMDEVQDLPIKKKKEHKLADGMLKLADGRVAMSFDCHALVHESNQ